MNGNHNSVAAVGQERALSGATQMRVRELEAWSKPGQQLPLDYAKDTLEQEIWATGIPKEMFLGLSAVLDATDCRNLRSELLSGTTTLQEFEAFCAAHYLSADSDCALSAMRFREFKHGRALAWIHLPEKAPGELLEKIAQHLRARGHVVVDPAVTSDFILASAQILGGPKKTAA